MFSARASSFNTLSHYGEPDCNAVVVGPGPQKEKEMTRAGPAQSTKEQEQRLSLQDLVGLSLSVMLGMVFTELLVGVRVQIDSCHCSVRTLSKHCQALYFLMVTSRPIAVAAAGDHFCCVFPRTQPFLFILSSSSVSMPHCHNISKHAL